MKSRIPVLISQENRFLVQRYVFDMCVILNAKPESYTDTYYKNYISSISYSQVHMVQI